MKKVNPKKVSQYLNSKLQDDDIAREVKNLFEPVRGNWFARMQDKTFLFDYPSYSKILKRTKTWGYGLAMFNPLKAFIVFEIWLNLQELPNFHITILNLRLGFTWGKK